MYDRHRLARRASSILLAAALCLLSAAAVPAAADYPEATGSLDYGDTAGYEGSYSYVRTIEGSATLIQGDTGDRESLQLNQPVLVGDRIWVSPRGRVEVILSDRNLLRIDGGSEVIFEALAASPDRQDRNTVLRLPQGNLQLVVVSEFLGEGVPRIDTANLTVYPRDLGTYRITADGADWGEVVAREGSAEVVTREGSVLVRAGEAAVVEGDLRPRSRVRSAGRLDSLELWGQRLDQEARYASSGYLDDSLRYEAASLDRYGTWVEVDTRYAWRPRVGVEWRPYSHGRWGFSPLGLNWVSYEPWGWVPYHYGSWDYLSGYGWVWFPGYRFAPAWVYWYWTDQYAGWVPVGYYTRHYRPYLGDGFGFRFGVYGWAGGHWGYYDRWTFCSTRYIGYRDQHHHARSGDRFGREHRYAVPRRGVLTTDTRGLSRVALQRNQNVEELLVAQRGRDLPDVTEFVARGRDLPQDVRGRVLVDTAAKADGRRERAQVLSVDGIPGSEASARRLRDAVGRDAAATAPGRAAIDAGRSRSAGIPPSGAELARKPAEKPAPSDAGFRSRPDVAGVERALPRQRTPEAVAPAPESRPRVEARPAPAPGDDWRNRVTAPRKPTVKEAGPVTAPSTRSTSPRAPVRVRPDAAPPTRRDPAASWRDRAILPAKPSERAIDLPDVRRSEPGASDWRQRDGSAGRYSIPRRVIEGVRSNNQGSTPFRPDPRVDAKPDLKYASPTPARPSYTPPAKIERRPSPVRPSSPPARIESRPAPSRPSSPPPRIESRPAPSRRSSPPARIESRPAPSRPSSPPARIESRPAPSRPSSPPPRTYSSPSRSSASRATTSRSSAASSSSRGKARSKPPGE